MYVYICTYKYTYIHTHTYIYTYIFISLVCIPFTTVKITKSTCCNDSIFSKGV